MAIVIEDIAGDLKFSLIPQFKKKSLYDSFIILHTADFELIEPIGHMPNEYRKRYFTKGLRASSFSCFVKRFCHDLQVDDASEAAKTNGKL